MDAHQVKEVGEGEWGVEPGRMRKADTVNMLGKGSACSNTVFLKG